MRKKNLKYAVGIAILASSVGAQATVVGETWVFDLPAVANYLDIYEPIATMTLTQEAGYVSFVLDPNEDSPGVMGWDSNNPDPSQTYIDAIDFVYSGHLGSLGDLTDKLEITSESTTPISSWSYSDGSGGQDNPNLDTSYTSTGGYISIEFEQKGENPFDFTEVATWIITGATLADFSDYFAWGSPNMPNPIKGIISSSSYSYSSEGKTTSNWVNGEISAVPVPAAAWLFGTALAGIAGLRARRRKTKTA